MTAPAGAGTPEGGVDAQAGARRPASPGRVIAILLAVLVAGVLVTGIVLYAVDYRIDATVQETRCDLLQVTVKTKQFGIEHTVRDVPADQCGVLEPGDFVQYRIRSQRTTLYDEEGGRCLYDSETGPYCGQRGGGGILGIA